MLLTYVLFTGCATKSTDIQPADVNASVKEHHQHYSCRQLQQKHAFIDKKLKRLSISLDEDSQDDTIIASTGWMLYGVPYLWLGGDEDNEGQFAHLLGLKEFIEELMIARDCTMVDPNELNGEGNSTSDVDIEE